MKERTISSRKRNSAEPPVRLQSSCMRECAHMCRYAYIHLPRRSRILVSNASTRSLHRTGVGVDGLDIDETFFHHPLTLAPAIPSPNIPSPPSPDDDDEPIVKLLGALCDAQQHSPSGRHSLQHIRAVCCMSSINLPLTP